jgi:Ser/Thr protein kinase RdoA (MazF antagonist)
MQHSLSRFLPYIPRIIFTKEGSPYAQIGEDFFLLTKYVEGDFFIEKLEQSVNCASALGEMHKTALEKLPSQSDFIDSTEETLRFIDMAEGLNFPSLDLKRSILNKMRESAAKYKATNIGKKGWLHGDFSPFNMVFKGDQLIAVNDFDNVAFGVLARDLAECLLTHTGINYAGTTSSLRTPIRRTIDSSRMKAMYIAYLEKNPISSSELVDLPNQMVLIWLELMVLGLLRGDFSLRDVEMALSHPDDIYTAAKTLTAV